MKFLDVDATNLVAGTRSLPSYLHELQGIFPFSGHAEETGVDKGLGYTINVPVYSQFGDSEYTFLLGQLLNAVCAQYLPQIILVSAGYDGHVDDNISQIRLSTRWFRNITMMLRSHAKRADRILTDHPLKQFWTL